MHNYSVETEMIPMNKTILLIEDDKILQELLTQLLSRQGYTVIGCRDGAMAVEYVVRFGPDLILSDLTLPGFNGLEITRMVRSDPVTAKIPVLIMSAHAAADYKKNATDAGANDYIAKPFNVNDLKKKIAEILDSAPSLS